MAVRIHTMAQMNAARRRVRFCYLCGLAHPPRGQPGWRKNLSVEHVVPRALLEEEPDDPVDRWRVTLPVCAECERVVKSQNDSFAAALLSVFTLPPAAWHPWELNQVVPKMGTEYQSATGFPTIDAGMALAAAWSWVRGLHTTLYGDFLWGGRKRSVLPPVAGINQNSRKPPAQQLEEFYSASAFSVKRVVNAVKAGNADEVRAWGGRMRYFCVWVENAEHGQPWKCVWMLAFPGVFEWSSSVMIEPRPWHGFYIAPSLPPGASVLREKTLRKASPTG